MSNNDYRQDILIIKEKIHDLKEYLESDTCKACYDVFLEIQKYEKILSEMNQ